MAHFTSDEANADTLMCLSSAIDGMNWVISGVLCPTYSVAFKKCSFRGVQLDHHHFNTATL